MSGCSTKEWADFFFRLAVLRENESPKKKVSLFYVKMRSQIKNRLNFIIRTMPQIF